MIVIHHNSALNNALAGLNAGIQQGIVLAKAKDEITNAAKAFDLANQREQRYAEAQNSQLQTDALQRAGISLQQSFEVENQDALRKARSVQEAERQAVSDGYALLSQIHGNPTLSDEETNSLVEKIKGIAARPELSPQSRQYFLEHVGDAAKQHAIDTSMKDVAELIGRMSQPTADAEGNQVPGVLDQGRAENMAQGLKLYRDSRGTAGLSPDDARKALWGVQSEQALKVTQGAAWTQSAQKMAGALATYSNPATGIPVPPANMEKAMFVLSLANSNPPKTVEQRAAVEKAFTEALFHQPPASEKPVGSVVERARAIAQKEADLGLFTVRDQNGHGNIDVGAYRAREDELIRQLSRAESTDPMSPFRDYGGGGQQGEGSASQPLPANSAPAASPAPAPKGASKLDDAKAAATEAGLAAKRAGKSDAEVRAAIEKALRDAGQDPNALAVPAPVSGTLGGSVMEPAKPAPKKRRPFDEK